VQADNAGLLTIGIGAGAGTAGQVLVLHDMLGITRGKRPRFVRDFAEGSGSVEAALRSYVAAVKSGAFPDPSHTY
jgi:3-methyl-2-oxobutanoate hydroxymethyltransferase